MPSHGNAKLAKINGDTVKLYYVGELARRIGRSSASIRFWEGKGIIPQTEFRDKRGRRLYTEEQIEAVVKAAKENHIQKGRPIAETNFSVDCHNAFNLLHKKYFGGDK